VTLPFADRCRLADILQGRSREELLDPFPKVKGWMMLVAETCAPHHSDASKVLMKSAAGAARQKAATMAKL
jgi:hypothetical protein